MRKTRDRASRHSLNFETGWVALPDPNPNFSKSWDCHPDLDLDPTRPDFCRDIIPSRYLAHSPIYLWPLDYKSCHGLHGLNGASDTKGRERANLIGAFDWWVERLDLVLLLRLGRIWCQWQWVWDRFEELLIPPKHCSRVQLDMVTCGSYINCNNFTLVGPVMWDSFLDTHSSPAYNFWRVCVGFWVHL